MTYRELRKLALKSAATVVEAAAEDRSGTLYAGLSEDDALDLDAELHRIANRLGRQFARLVHADVVRARS